MQLTPYFISVEAIQQGLDKRKGTAMKKGFLLSTYSYNEALQLEASFVSLTNGTIFALLHIPAFKSMSTLYIYRYIPIPIASNDNGSSLIIAPENDYLALSLKEQFYMEISCPLRRL